MDGFADELNSLQTQIETLADSKYNKKKLMWDFLYKAYPEMKEFNINYNNDIKFMTVLKRLKEAYKI